MDREIAPAIRRRQALRRWARPLLAAAAGVALLAWLAVGIQPRLERSRLRIATVERGPVDAVISASGTVEPATAQVLSSAVDGRVLRVLRQPGARLRPGDPILELDTGESQLELDRLLGRLEQAEARRRELEVEREERVSALRGELEIRELAVELAEWELERQRALRGEGLVSETELRRTETERRKLEIERDTARRAIASAERSLAARGGSLDAELAVLRHERAAVEDRLARATTQADRPGVLTWVLDEEGAAVSEGQVLARIASPDRYRVEAAASDVHAERLSPGQAVLVSPHRELTLDGEIARVLPAVEAGRLGFVVELAEPSHPALRPNLRVDVFVVTDTRGDVLGLARGPWFAGGSRQDVFVVRGGRAYRRAVDLGLVGRDRIEVAAGLEEGERVVTSDVREYLHLEEIAVR